MPARTPREAVERFIEPLKAAIGCIVRAPLGARAGYRPSIEPYALVLGRGDPIPLLRGNRISLRVRMRYRIVEAPGQRDPWRATVTGYDYTFSDEAGRDLLAYHWHPGGASHVDTAHLHLGVATGITHEGLREAHVPTGRVSLESIVRLAIEAFDVRPLRPDWQRTLERGEETFNRLRTW